MVDTKLWEVLDALENESKIRISAIARAAMPFLSPYTKNEQAALNLYDNNLEHQSIALIRDRLWQEFDSLNGRERSRKRLFINLLAGVKRISDGDFGAMAETMAQAGISDADILRIFINVSS